MVDDELRPDMGGFGRTVLRHSWNINYTITC